MTDRDRLIELIAHVQYMGGLESRLADHLLANGVIVPPCKVGGDVYWIDTETNEINCAKNDIKAVCYYGEDRFKVIVQDECTPEEIGTKWCLLTKEQAEQALRGMVGDTE